MTTTRRRIAARLVLLLLTVGGPIAPAAAAASADEGCEGVRVLVDAREAGGPLTIRCVPGDPSSGLDALEAAGHDYGFVPRIPGMVCTVDGRPDPCNHAPDDAYWSYWHAEPEGSWTYGARGAAQRDPEPGTVEGWVFGAGDPPAPEPPSVDAAAGGTTGPASGAGTGAADGAQGDGGRLGVIVGLALAGTLAAAAVWRGRRRSAETGG